MPPYVLAAHMHTLLAMQTTQSSAEMLLRTAEYVPGLQSVHALDPSADAYEPPVQLRHALLPSVPTYVPTMQLRHDERPLCQ